MERLKQQIRKKQEEMSRSTNGEAPKESPKEISKEAPRVVPKAVPKGAPKEATRTLQKTGASKSVTKTGPANSIDIIVVDQGEANRTSVDDRDATLEHRTVDEKMAAAEAARSSFMKEEQTLKDCLNKLHQTEAHLHGIQRDLDDTAYAEVTF